MKKKLFFFEIEQPCEYVWCSFSEVEDFIFETEKEAIDKQHELEFGVGLRAYRWIG